MMKSEEKLKFPLMAGVSCTWQAPSHEQITASLYNFQRYNLNGG